MSLDSLLSEDTITVQAATAGQDNSGGATRLPYKTVAGLANIDARVEDLSASGSTYFNQFQELVTHRVFTMSAGILNGHYILTSDSVFCRVVGIKKQRGIGGLDTFWEIEAQEMKRK